MNIYIGNLSYEARESDLRKMLEEYGTVKSLKLITDKGTGRSKGFGFIEIENNTEAFNAIQGLNGKEYLGRPIAIKEAILKD